MSERSTTPSSETYNMTKKYPKSFKGKKLNTLELKSIVNRELKHRNGKSYSAAGIIKKLKISNSRDEVQHVLDKLVKEGRVRQTAGDVYQSNNKSTATERLLVGTVDVTRSGAAYIIIGGKTDDVYVGAGDLLGALDGDTVEISVARRRGRQKPDGRVTRIIRRSREIFMGRIFINKKYSVVTPFKTPDGFEIFIFNDKLNGAEDGDIVTARVISWPDGKNKMIKGEVTEVLSSDNASDMEMKSILIGQGFDLQFAKETMSEADAIPEVISEQEIALRRDMRDVTTFTIAPATAKDFDDALSYRGLDDGRVEIGVHIADVSHYVKPGGPLDKEAYERSTSVYLVDRVLPMLPEKLSNELCSLRPNEDKLTFSAVFVFDKEANIVSKWFGKTIIHSNRRYAYEEAQEIIEKGEGDYALELAHLNQIATKIRERRYAKGAISFESDEIQFKLDENGFPVEIFIKERKDAHLMVEDFMLLANRSVAEYIHKKGVSGEIPFVYRVHDRPDNQKLSDFATFAAEMGFKMDLSSPKAVVNSFNTLAKKAEEDDTLRLLTPLAIRTMAKAEYTTNNIGHFGLGFEDYTHFTSPIRRYSDVLVHRILYKNLGSDIYREDKDRLEILCKHISSQERKAMDAERESIKYKQVEFMSRFVGSEFDGIISGIHDRGVFVELAGNHCEGMIRFDRFEESFILDDSKMKAFGRNTGRTIKIGDRIRIRVLDADLNNRQLDFAPVMSKKDN